MTTPAKKTAKKKPISHEAFYTKPLQDKGVRLDLFTPEGEESGHHFTVVGTDSETFKLGVLEVNRKFLDQDPKTDVEKLNFNESRNREMIALLIVGWSFEMDCNTENKAEVLKNAPQLQKEVDRFANRKANFCQPAEKS